MYVRRWVAWRQETLTGEIPIIVAEVKELSYRERMAAINHTEISLFIPRLYSHRARVA